MLAGCMILFAACQDDEKTIPVSLDFNSITATQSPGMVVLHWTKPSNPDYRYLMVSYTLPDGDYMRTASSYSDSIAIPDLLARYGDIDFTIRAVSEDGGMSEPYTITAQAGRALTTIEVIGETPIQLSASGLYTDDQEVYEGPIENLIDGNTATFFHMSWSSPTPFPHYIVVDLGTEVQGFKFSYTSRNHNNKDNPNNMEIWCSNSFDGSTYDLEGNSAVLAGTLDESTLPNGKLVTYNSGNYIMENAYRYIWFKINSSYSGSQWIALSELSISELQLQINDPEAI